MASGSMTTYIERSAEDVFAFVSDIENNPSWRSYVVESVWIDDSPMRLGRRGRQISRVLGRTYETTAEVVQWDPPGRVGWATREGGTDVHTACQVEAEGEGCRFAISAQGDLSGSWKRFLSPLATVMIRRQVSADLKRLKVALETSDGESRRRRSA